MRSRTRSGRRDLGKHQDLLFPYLYIKDHIKICAITVSRTQIEISPPFLPSSVTHPFAQDDMRRVYLSATLQTQAEFARAFGKRPDVMIAPETDAGNGERCILFGAICAGRGHRPQVGERDTKQAQVGYHLQKLPRGKTVGGSRNDPKATRLLGRVGKIPKGTVGRPRTLLHAWTGIDLPDDVCRGDAD